jgi:hypothetical protein
MAKTKEQVRRALEERGILEGARIRSLRGNECVLGSLDTLEPCPSHSSVSGWQMADANGTDRHVYYDRNDSYATVLTPASSAAKAEPAPDDEGLRAQDAVKVTKAQWEAINEAFKDIAFDGFGKYPNAVQVFWDPSSAHLNSYTTNKERSSVNYLPFHEFWRRAEITLEQRKPKVPTIKYRDDHGRGNTYVLTPQKGLVNRSHHPQRHRPGAGEEHSRGREEVRWRTQR